MSSSEAYVLLAWGQMPIFMDLSEGNTDWGVRDRMKVTRTGLDGLGYVSSDGGSVTITSKSEISA